MLTIKIRQSFAILAAIITIGLLPLTTVVAAGPTGPVGPTEPVGPTAPVGPTSTPGPVPTPSPTTTTVDPSPSPTPAPGPTEPVGPTAPVGPTEPVGPQAALSTTNDPPAVSSQTNSGAGDNSNNINSSDNNSTTTTNVTNTAHTSNAVNLTAGTGHNTVNENTEVGKVTTGDINGSVTLVNVANSSFAPGSTLGTQTLDGSQLHGLSLDALAPSNTINLPTSQSNGTTGNGSNNTNRVAGNDAIIVNTNNLATADNTVLVNATTGGNTAARNTALGGLSTGDINLGINNVNLMNVQNPDLQLTMDVTSIAGGLNGDIVIPQANSLTGANSANSNNAALSQSAAINIDNNTNATNNIQLATNTGNNQLIANSQVGNIQTGSTNVGGTVENIANADNPVVYLVNVFGRWLGHLAGVGNNVIVNQINNQTGANSNNGDLADTSSTATVNTTNTARVNNLVVINADTGDNIVDHNTKVGDVSTGNINIYSSFVNVLNSLGGSLGHLTIHLINIFGDWNGDAATPAAEEAKTADNATTAPVFTPASEPVQTTTVADNVAPPVAVAVATAPPAPAASPASQSASAISFGGGQFSLPFTTHSVENSTWSSSSHDQKSSTPVIAGTTGGDDPSPPSASTPTPHTGISPKLWYVLGSAGLLLAVWLGLEAIAFRSRKFYDGEKA